MTANKRKLAIITSHPIQYNAPLFKRLAERGVIDSKVFYTWGDSSAKSTFDPGFGKTISWDLPLLEGYPYEYVENVAQDKGTHHFNGIINPHLIRQINAFKPDAILVYGWSFRSHLKVMFHFKRKLPVFFRGDSTLINDPKGFSIKKFIRFLSLSVIYKLIDFALFVGESNKQYFLKFGLRSEQLIYAPHVVDNKRFSDGEQAYEERAAERRKELGFTGNELVFLYVGKFQEAKNLDFLLATFLSIPDASIRLLLVGNGPLEEELRKKAGTDNRIRFLGFQNQSEMPVVYRLGDIFVLPSKSETWGLAVNEAMACGKPVLISQNCGCAADLVEEGYNGWSFENGNVEQLRKKFIWYITNRSQISDMGKHSIEMIGAFNLDKVAEAIEKPVSGLNS